MKSKNTTIVGFLAGAFDLLHPGYIHMFKEAKKFCDHLIVALHQDPSLERNSKLQPVLSVEDREIMLLSLRDGDEVIVYKTEKDLYNILRHTKINIRFLGSDYTDKDYTGSNLPIPICYINRDHGWSTTKLKNMIKESL